MAASDHAKKEVFGLVRAMRLKRLKGIRPKPVEAAPEHTEGEEEERPEDTIAALEGLLGAE